MKPNECKPDAPAALPPATGSVPDGFRLLKSSDVFCVGDIVADCEGKWRGPITSESDMVSREIRGYMLSNTEVALPAVRAAARRTSPNDKLCREAGQETP